MKKYGHLSLIGLSALLVLVVVSLYHTRVSTAGEAANTATESGDVFQIGKIYDLSISDAGVRNIYRCRVVETRGNWVSCQAAWQDPSGRATNGNLWLNSDHIAVVQLR